MIKKTFVLMFLLLFVFVLGACGAVNKPLAANSLKNAKIAVVYDFEVKTTVRGFFTIGNTVKEKIAKLLEANLASINSAYLSLIKEFLPKLAPRIVVSEDAIFKGADFNEGSWTSARFKKLVAQGYTHVLLFKYIPEYTHSTIDTDKVNITFELTLSHIKSDKDLANYSESPKIDFRDKNKKSWKYEDVVGLKETTPHYLLKAIFAGMKFMLPKAVKYIKTGVETRIERKYNGELFLNSYGS